MSFDALIMPPAPRPPAAGTGSAPGTQPAAFELDRPTQSADQDQRFLATLNRVCERKSCSPTQSRGSESRSARSDETPPAAAQHKNNRGVVDQEALQDRPVESEACDAVKDGPFACRQRSLGLMHQALLSMAFAGDGTAAIAGQSDSNGSSEHTFVNQLIGHVYSNGHSQLPGLMGIGPFEQLQADISAQAGNLHFFKQLANQALNDQPAADPGGRVEAFTARIEHLIDFLLHHYEKRFMAPGLKTAPAEAGGQKAAVTVEAVAVNENLLQKMIEPKQPAEIQAATAGKDGHGPAGTAKNVSAEALLEARTDKNGEDGSGARMQSGSKSAEPAANPNLAGQSVTARPAEQTIHLKASALHNDMMSAAQTGNKVIQIDGESKDSGFLTSQENLPEHLSKLESASRSTEGAQRSLASQTLNQIVQKAVLLNNNGQNTVQIDLKPEFLGHIRMQIMTESQQVAVRIVAELPFVKDMLENNLNQLKAELQAQGLQVDELEVSVAHDSRAEDDRYQKAADLRRARALQNNPLTAEGEVESQKAGPAVQPDGMAQSAVDYFA